MIIGITGGIGTGKSTILKILQEKYGFVIFEADKIGHELMANGQEAYAKLSIYLETKFWTRIWKSTANPYQIWFFMIKKN